MNNNCSESLPKNEIELNNALVEQIDKELTKIRSRVSRINLLLLKIQNGEHKCNEVDMLRAHYIILRQVTENLIYRLNNSEINK